MRDLERHVSLSAGVADEPLHGLYSPYSYSLLQRTKLSEAVLSRVTGLEVDKKFKCGLSDRE